MLRYNVNIYFLLDVTKITLVKSFYLRCSVLRMHAIPQCCTLEESIPPLESGPLIPGILKLLSALTLMHIDVVRS